MNKVCVTIRERVCSGVERDWQLTFDSDQEAKEATKDLPHNCWIVNGPSPIENLDTKLGHIPWR